MKLNSNIKIIGKKTILVPYREQHVPKYHEWMKSEELQMLTASEPLTIEKEYEMQKSWKDDEDKCTFIILDQVRFNDTNDEIISMIGDTNIFVKSRNSDCTGEIEIMIAENSYRGKKYGWEAVILMFIYGVKYIKINRFEAKISYNNSASIKMFQKLGFLEKTRSDVFQEATFEKHVDSSWIDWLEKENHYKINVH